MTKIIKKFTIQDVVRIAKLANIPTTTNDEQSLTDAFGKTMGVVDALISMKVGNAQPTSHVTGIENVFRDDEIDAKRMFTQDEALKNASRQHSGYFVVGSVFAEE